MALLQNDVVGPVSRVRQLVVTPPGAAGAGHEPSVGAGGVVPVLIQVPAAQTANAFEIRTAAGVLLAKGDSAGRLTSPVLQYATVAISAANITDTAAGHLGHASGVVLVADPGAGLLVELVSAVMSFTFATAQYTAGGNITVNINGGSALTGLISNANSLASASSNITQFVPLSTAGNALTANKGLNLVAAVAFTQPGTAAGTVKVFVTYRVHTL